MSAPRIRQFIDRGGRHRMILIRSEAAPGDVVGGALKAVTVRFTSEEQAILETAVLAKFGLVSERVVLERLGEAYEEVERAQEQIAGLERELTYASGQGDDEDADEDEVEIEDPPPLLAHGTEWVSGEAEDD